MNLEASTNSQVLLCIRVMIEIIIIRSITFKNWRNFKHAQSTDGQHLTQCQFHEKHWYTSQD